MSWPSVVSVRCPSLAERSLDGHPASSYPGRYEGAWYYAVGRVVDQGVEPFSKFEADAVVVGHAAQTSERRDMSIAVGSFPGETISVYSEAEREEKPPQTTRAP